MQHQERGASAQPPSQQPDEPSVVTIWDWIAQHRDSDEFSLPAHAQLAARLGSAQAPTADT